MAPVVLIYTDICLVKACLWTFSNLTNCNYRLKQQQQHFISYITGSNVDLPL